MFIGVRKYLIILAGVGVLSSCATSPTGRKQLMLLSESQMDSQGVAAFDQVKKETPIDTDPKINSYVQCVVDPITKIVNQKQGKSSPWEVVVFKSDEVNAFALPGGKVGVYTGIFKAAQNADQLAAVLGHEVGHVLARHGDERASEAFVAQGLLTAAGALAGTQSKRNQILLALAGAGAQYGVILPHSRTQESEADLIGLDLMARAGFNPNQAIDLWNNMTKVAGSSPPEFLSDHPSNSRRIKDLQASIAKELPLYQQAPNHPNCKL